MGSLGGPTGEKRPAVMKNQGRAGRRKGCSHLTLKRQLTAAEKRNIFLNSDTAIGSQEVAVRSSLTESERQRSADWICSSPPTRTEIKTL